MEFHETVRGKRFFESQLPRLISTLEEIAGKLDIAPPLPAPSKDVLRELYYGNNPPVETRKTMEYTAINQKVLDQQKIVKKRVSQESWDEIEKLMALCNARAGAELEQMFGIGYRCAFQLLIAGLTVERDLIEKSEGAQT